MSAVFGHGRLRLYLLKLLEEAPRHGYEIIRLLEDRFMGLYTPSAGTIYPRLQRMEAEGLVTHRQEGGRKVYRITEAGREEVARRTGEVRALDAEVRAALRALAQEIREDVHSTVRDLGQELKQAASEMRRQRREQRPWQRGRAHGRGPGGSPSRPSWDGESPPADQQTPAATKVEKRLREFLDWTLAFDGAHFTDAQLRECAGIVEEAVERLRTTLRPKPD